MPLYFENAKVASIVISYTFKTVLYIPTSKTVTCTMARSHGSSVVSLLCSLIISLTCLTGTALYNFGTNLLHSIRLHRFAFIILIGNFVFSDLQSSTAPFCELNNTHTLNIPLRDLPLSGTIRHTGSSSDNQEC